jgi:hypothetical protein
MRAHATRVKISPRGNLPSGVSPNRAWALVRGINVGEFISTSLQLDAGVVPSVSLEGFALPLSEDVAVLRDGDEITVEFKEIIVSSAPAVMLATQTAPAPALIAPADPVAIIASVAPAPAAATAVAAAASASVSTAAATVESTSTSSSSSSSAGLAGASASVSASSKVQPSASLNGRSIANAAFSSVMSQRRALSMAEKRPRPPDEEDQSLKVPKRSRRGVRAGRKHRKSQPVADAESESTLDSESEKESPTCPSSEVVPPSLPAPDADAPDMSSFYALLDSGFGGRKVPNTEDDAAGGSREYSYSVIISDSQRTVEAPSPPAASPSLIPVPSPPVPQAAEMKSADNPLQAVAPPAGRQGNISRTARVMSVGGVLRALLAAQPRPQAVL